MWRGWRYGRDAPCAAPLERLPQSRVPSWRGEPEVLVGARRGDAAARRAIEESGLDQKRLVHVLDRVFFFIDGGGNAVQANRPPAEFVDDRAQQLAIDLVEAL